jgi:hypothetical protein
MPPTASTDQDLNRLQILHGFKQLLGRKGQTNVTPFTEQRVVTYATDVRPLDVPEIHAEQRQLIEGTLKEVAERQTAKVIILAGGPGMGKSHLLNCFRLPVSEQKGQYVFVSSSNHWDIEEFEECLLDQLLAALVRPSLEQPHLLLERVQAIAFLALEQVLTHAGHRARFFRPSGKTVLSRAWKWLTGSNAAAQIGQMVFARDATVFRRIDFQRFCDYVCPHFLAEPNNLLHRYVLRVLLCYLFAEEREMVLHWLRGRPVEAHFTRKLGIGDALDRNYKRMEAIRLLISLFSPELPRGLSEAASATLAPRTFFFAFDQTEGRDELFEKEEDWFTFFAQLSELYNTLPNVLILFTMTLSLRDKLHPRLEKQFQDRVRRDDRFLLRYIEPKEILALYRARLERWVETGPEQLRELVKTSDNPYLPLDRQQVLALTDQRTLRDAMEVLDQAFGEEIRNVIFKVELDYSLWLNDLTRKASGSPYEDTETHLASVEQVLATLAEPLANLMGMQFLSIKAVDLETAKLTVLELRFCEPGDERRRVCCYRYGDRVESCLHLLHNKRKNRYSLWLVRPGEIDSELLQSRPEQAFFRKLDPELEFSLRAILCALVRRPEYSPEEWHSGEKLFLQLLRQSYLGDLFEQTAQNLKRLPAQTTEEPEEMVSQPDLPIGPLP